MPLIKMERLTDKLGSYTATRHKIMAAVPVRLSLPRTHISESV